MNEFNGNGNGHQKAFELTQPKTAEQIKREALNNMMPQLRRNCSQDQRLKKFVGAKWLFTVLTDNSFMNKFGGDGWGRVYCSLKDLRRLYGHDEDTIAVWRDKLIQTGWIWCQNRWPKCCWGICGACDQPELPFAGQEYMAIMAKTSARGQPSVAVGDEEIQKTVNSGANGHAARSDQPPAAVTPTANGGYSDGAVRAEEPSTAVSLPANSGSDQPSMAVTPTVNGGHCGSESPVDRTAIDGHIRETPALKPSGGRKFFKRSTDFNASKTAGGAKKLNAENLFLLDVGTVIENWRQGASKKELAEFGACWRLAHRLNPTVARSTLDEISSMVKEHKIIRCPSAAAFATQKGVWFIFGGAPISREAADKALAARQQKAAGGTAART